MLKYIVAAILLSVNIVSAQQPPAEIQLPKYNSWEIDRQREFPTPKWADKAADGTLFKRKETVEIYTDVGVTTSGGRMIVELAAYMSTIDDRYNYRYSNVVGAAGESAIGRAVALARAGRKVIIYSGSHAFTFNRDEKTLEKSIKYDKDKDFVFLQAVATNQFGVIVHKDAPFQNVFDLVTFVKNSKEPVFFGRTANAGTNSVLGDLFIKQYDLGDKIKIVRYPNLQVMIYALQQKEILFTVHAPHEFSEAKPLLMAGYRRSPLFPDTPTGKEINFRDFSLEGLGMFFAPKDAAQLAIDVLPTIKRMCTDEEALTIIRNSKRTLLCLDSREVQDYINEENENIKNSKNRDWNIR
jgi:tripartite-type tricarboxylate transporter receptor subunit TctC